ncbi:KxYKxGKxW signal peptide domain-containing protein, partial [Leuconostoc pseudomesenteroides]|uniref:KxYKxGKxW signal peptide domain-containing protein n=1 Tax=Leuconostoc pseudomesenteroides TaxID=33968 RepID=UPI0039EA5B3B
MSAKYDGRSSRQTNEVKRYKMYKSGRQWITAGLSTLMVLTGMALIDDTDKVSADTTTGSTAMAASAAANPASAADNTLSNTTSEAVSSANVQVLANSASDSYATGSLGSSAYPTLDSVATDKTVSADVNDQNAISVDKNADATSNAVDVTTSASATSSSAASTYNNGSVAVTITAPSNATSSLVSPTQSGSTVTTAGGSTATVTSDALATIEKASSAAASSAASAATSYSSAATSQATALSNAQSAASSAQSLLNSLAANQGVDLINVLTMAVANVQAAQTQNTLSLMQQALASAKAGDYQAALNAYNSAASLAYDKVSAIYGQSELLAVFGTSYSLGTSLATYTTKGTVSQAVINDTTPLIAASSASSTAQATLAAAPTSVQIAANQSAAAEVTSQATSLADSYAALLNADTVLVNVNYNADTAVTSAATASATDAVSSYVTALTNGMSNINTDSNLKFSTSAGSFLNFNSNPQSWLTSYATTAGNNAAAASNTADKSMWITVQSYASSLANDINGAEAQQMISSMKNGNAGGMIPALTFGQNNADLTAIQATLSSLMNILKPENITSATYVNPVVDNGDGTYSTNISLDPNELVHSNIDALMAQLTANMSNIQSDINTYASTTVPNFVIGWYAVVYSAFNGTLKGDLNTTALKLISQGVAVTVDSQVKTLAAGYIKTLTNAMNAISGTDSNSMYAKSVLETLITEEQKVLDQATIRYNSEVAYLGTSDISSLAFRNQVVSSLGGLIGGGVIGGTLTDVVTGVANAASQGIATAVDNMMKSVNQASINLVNGLNSMLQSLQSIKIAPTITVTAGFDTGTPDVSDVAAGQFATTTYSATYTGAVTGTSATVIGYQAIDKTQLQSLVNTTTANSNLASVMAAQLTAAQQVLTNDNASQQDLNQAYANLVAQTATITVTDATTGQVVTLTSDSTVYGGSGTMATFDLSKVMPAGYDFSQAVVTGGTIDANGVLTVNFDNDSTVDQPVTIDVPHKITTSSKVNTFNIQLTYEDASGNILQPATTTTVTGTATLATDGVTGVTTQSGAVVWQGADGVASDGGTTYTVNSIDVPATITSNGQTYYLQTPGEDAQGNVIEGTNAITLTFDENQTVASTQTMNEVYGAAQQVALKMITLVKTSDYTDPVSSALKEFTDAAGNKYYIVNEAVNGADLAGGSAHIGDTIDGANLQAIINSYDPENAASVGLSAAGYNLSEQIYWDTLGNTTVPGTYTINGAIAEADGSYTHYLIIIATPQTTSATVNYVDDETGSVISTATISGQVGSLFDVDGSDTLNGEQQYDTADYQLVSVDNGSGTYVMSAGTDGTSVDATPAITVHLQMSIEKSTSISESESMSVSTVESLSDSTSTSTAESLSDSTSVSTSESLSDSTSVSTAGSLSGSTSTSGSLSNSTSVSASGSLSSSTSASASGSLSDSTSASTSGSLSGSTSTSTAGSLSDSTSTAD